MKYDTFFFKLPGDAFILRIHLDPPRAIIISRRLGEGKRQSLSLLSYVLVIRGGSGHDFTSLSGHCLS
jgi:hypothetical protein